MSLDPELVRRARGLTDNLSETVEGLLAGFVAAEEARRAAQQAQSRRWAEASAAQVAAHGAPADEHDPF
jgi:post-segregation antitoxin (ccd killing protein)